MKWDPSHFMGDVLGYNLMTCSIDDMFSVFREENIKMQKHSSNFIQNRFKSKWPPQNFAWQPTEWLERNKPSFHHNFHMSHFFASIFSWHSQNYSIHKHSKGRPLTKVLKIIDNMFNHTTIALTYRTNILLALANTTYLHDCDLRVCWALSFICRRDYFYFSITCNLYAFRVWCNTS